MALDWDNIIIVDNETAVEGEEESVVIFASGIPGQSATIEEVTAEALEPGAEPTVENYGSSQNARFHFGIPKGEKGEPGSEWGGIGGNIEDQEDLYQALNSKVSIAYSNGYLSIS